jgi:hypothetical protein
MTLPTTAGRQARRPYLLRGKARKVALTAHILAAVGWFGVALVVAFCGIAASATSDPTLSPALYRTMETSLWLSIPIGLTAVATGTLLGLGTVFGLIRHWWVLAKLAIAVAIVVTDAVLVGRVAHDAVISGAAPPALYGSTIAHTLLLAIAAVLSVFKPWGRTAWGRRVLATKAER